jgi:putative Ca2+/H+ antiporter (TMEM165/GDT1 family)
VSGLLLIFFSEIGDKTFFIALLLALREVRQASKQGGGEGGWPTLH